MAVFLAKRITGGYLAYAEVPTKLKDAVTAELIATGHEDLIQAN